MVKKTPRLDWDCLMCNCLKCYRFSLICVMALQGTSRLSWLPSMPLTDRAWTSAPTHCLTIDFLYFDGMLTPPYTNQWHYSFWLSGRGFGFIWLIRPQYSWAWAGLVHSHLWAMVSLHLYQLNVLFKCWTVFCNRAFVVAHSPYLYYL